MRSNKSSKKSTKKVIFLKFKEVTSENLNIVATCRNNGLGPETVKVYESGSSMIIYSFNDQVKHISLSNPIRKISEREIIYMIRKIMKVNPEKVTAHLSSNGVYHFHYSPVNQSEQYLVSEILQ